MSDLHAVDPIYHAACSSMFRSKKSIPPRFMTQKLPEILEDIEPDIKKTSKKGQDTMKDVRRFWGCSIFSKENDEEQLIVSELVAKILWMELALNRTVKSTWRASSWNVSKTSWYLQLLTGRLTWWHSKKKYPRYSRIFITLKKLITKRVRKSSLLD